ncbi:MAG: hypothetical protein ABUK01_18650, partial [Leptospirales bacterium]
MKYHLLLAVLSAAILHCSSTQTKGESEKAKNEIIENPVSEFDNKKYSIQPGDNVSLESESEDFSSEKIDQKSEENKSAEKSAKNKPKKEPVHYSGRRLVREIKYHKRIKKKGVVLSIQGRARVRHGQTELRSTKIEILGEDGNIIYINRKLAIDDKAYHTYLTAGFGEYRKLEKTAYVTKNPVAIHTNVEEGTKTILKATEMFRDFNNGTIHAKGNVEIIHSDGVRGYGKEAYFYEKEDLIILMGNPTIYEEENIYKSDVMKFYNGERLVLLEGHASVYLTREETTSKDDSTATEGKKTDSSADTEIGEVTTIIRGPGATYRFGDEAPMGREVVFTGTDEDPVKIFRPDMEGTCLKLVSRGEKTDEIDASGNVYILDLKDRTRLYTQNATFRKEADLVVISTHYQTDEARTPPRVVFHNKKDQPTGILHAEKISYLDKAGIVTAEGDVIYQSLEGGAKERENPTTINGQWARYESKIKKIEIRGDPFLAQGESRVFARKIIITTDIKRVEIFGPVYGNIINQSAEPEAETKTNKDG